MAVEIQSLPERGILHVQTMENDTVADVPLEVGSTARPLSNNSGNVHLQFTELISLPDDADVATNETKKSWDLNYREAAIYLEEGINNDKLTSHPSSHEALPAYLLVHNEWYYALDLAAALLLVSLAFTEKPANSLFQLPVGVHSSVELSALLVVSVELVLKFRWLGFKTSMNHPRSMVKAVTLVIMVAETIVVLVRQSSHFRVTRALRPIFVIDNYYFGGVRRYLRQVLQSVPPAIDMLGLILFVMLFFSILGFYLFGTNVNDPYFSTLQQAFLSLFILLTTANYPDVMMPCYAVNSWSAVFFIAYLSIVLYFLMNLVLAAVYASFSSMEKKKFQQLLLHRRKAAQHAFRLLLSRKSRHGITLQHFRGLIHHVDSSKSYRDVYLMFRLLNPSASGFIDVEEFYNIYDALNMKWKVRDRNHYWFTNIRSQWVSAAARQVNRLVTWNVFEYFICLIIFLSGILILIRTAALSKNLSNPLELGATWESFAFVAFYSLEASLKMFGLGMDRYFASGWNTFDFLITSTSVIGLFVEVFGQRHFLVIARHLRILRLFKLRKRYRDVFGTVFILAQRLVSAGIVFLICYYAFSIVGMELFAQYDLTNCCKNSSVEAYFYHEMGSPKNGYYYLNNFENLMSSYVTLFELTVVNNWYIVMEGYAWTVSHWSRLYFMTFYIVTMLLLSIVVASVLDGFIFRITYKQQMSKDDENRLVEKHVSITADEFQHIKLTEIAEEAAQKASFWKSAMKWLRSREPFILLQETTISMQATRTNFTGYRARTKDILLSFMYKEEISCWIEQAAQEEQLEQQREFNRSESRRSSRQRRT